MQVVLRRHHQHGAVPIPKSADQERMAQNPSVFDFALTDADISTLDKASRGSRLGGDPDTHVEL